MAVTLFRLPPELMNLVYSYLSVPALGSWRLVNEQAFHDVESISRDKLQRVCGFVILSHSREWFGSAWFQLMKNTYTCVQCSWVQPSGTEIEEAEEEGLCLDCFSRLDDVKRCTACGTHEHMDVSGICEDCLQFWCEECAEDVIDMCMECTGLFCNSCRLDDTCLNC